MTTPDKQNGLLRPTYNASNAHLDNFPALESDWRSLLPRLAEASGDIRYRNEGGGEGMLADLWTDHVLTVLVEIDWQDLSADAKSLNDNVGNWIARLDRYIDRSWKAGSGESPAVRVARQLKERLVTPSSDKNNTEKQACYRNISTIRTIQEYFDYYLAQIEDSGDMDGALSLLLAYLRNYGSIAQTFNNRFASLPGLYLRDILHAVPRGVTQDSTYIIITPPEDAPGYTMPAGQSFSAGQTAAGEELIYQALRQEYITPMQCAEANAVFVDRKNGKATDIRKQAVCIENLSTPETLFADKHSQTLPLGWMVESSMLILSEGERNVCISFRITADTIQALPPLNSLSGSFTLHTSDAEGWTEQSCTCRIDTSSGDHRLCFDFLIASDKVALAPCNEETHGTTTACPAIRISTSQESSPYDWATQLKFDAVKIQTDVTAIRNFTFYNELGEVDTSQPFQPFGIQAEKGAWFLFGNEETGLKPLKEVRLQGNWKKLPETEAEFNQLYKSYTAVAGQAIDTGSFTISTEWQQGGKWLPCKNGVQHLFVPDNGEERSLNRAEVVFDFTKKALLSRNATIPYIYSSDKNISLRTILQTPTIGFGTDAYRNLFTETILHNSRCKEKKCKYLPSEPVVPMLADVELSYIASEETTLADMENLSIRLYRITTLSEEEPFPISKESEQAFLPAVTTDHLLYLAFLHAQGEQIIRIYLDLVLPKEKIPFYNPQPDKSIKLSWEYWNGNSWQPVPTQSVTVEETCGLTQSGFIEIKLSEKIKDTYMDKQGRAWIRAAVTGDISSCLAIRNIWTNCIRLTAQNGDGSSLPAGTIQGMEKADERIESIVQPLPGFGGRPAETETQSAVRQSARIHNRHRALTIKDYEQLVLEHFPEVDKVKCIPVPRDKGASEICLVVFSRAEDNRYYLSQAWKLAEIQRLIRQYAPPFVYMRVINPVYERVKVHCKAVLWDSVQDENKAIRQLVVLAQNYIAPWYRKKEIPALCQSFSYKELHARMVNHEDLMKLATLEVDMEHLPHTDINEKNPVFKGSHPWSVLLPEIKIELLSPHEGINEAEIGGNFIIG